MVTLKRVKGLGAFSSIGADGLIENEITLAFEDILRGFHEKWRCIEEISPFVMMPDHIHFILKIKDCPDRQPLGRYVYQLERALSAEYWRIRADVTARSNTRLARGGSASGGYVRPIFEKDWHDWIVKKRGQLAAFRRYIRENASRAWARRANAQYFQRVGSVEFLGRRWWAYGNPEMLQLPEIVSFKGHRATAEGSEPWNAALECAGRIGPGGAGISTFMSPLEKACGNAIAKAGGRLIVLSPEGFSQRWHPARDKEIFCARGRMLFLSLYEATARRPTKSELYARCREMADIVRSAIPGVEA